MKRSELRAYENLPVLVTGHTGFKGAWLTLWLEKIGAKVSGFSLPAPVETHNLFTATKIDETSHSQFGDIRNVDSVLRVFEETQPKIVYHLAAQSLVRQSYANPLETFATNVIGTANVLEAARHSSSLEAVVIVTSDKCYDNQDLQHRFTEVDPMGGKDPYSASKGCAELVTAAYRQSFCLDQPLIASARAGNVIGGGDWSDDRLIPDIVRAIMAGEQIKIRNPSSTRPWQHVIDLLSGYLSLGARLLDGDKEFADSWNFGPKPGGALPVKALADKFVECWGEGLIVVDQGINPPAEASYLDLDISKAQERLRFEPEISIELSIEMTVDWYKKFLFEGVEARELVLSQIEQFS